MTDQQLRERAEKVDPDRWRWMRSRMVTGPEWQFSKDWSPTRALAALAVIEAGRRLFFEGDGDPATQEQMETALAAWDALGGDA